MPKILLVDDEEDIILLFSRVLRAAGYSVSTASGPREAIQLAAAQAFDLLITDIDMSGGNGFQLANDLLTVHPGLQVILMSGAERDASLIELPLLAKPFSNDRLLALIADVLQRRAPAPETS